MNRAQRRQEQRMLQRTHGLPVPYAEAERRKRARRALRDAVREGAFEGLAAEQVARKVNEIDQSTT